MLGCSDPANQGSYHSKPHVSHSMQYNALLTALLPHHRTAHDGSAMLLCRCAYTNWTTTARGCDDFFTDPNVIQLYKNHVQKVLTRVNTVNHIAYQNDSTILGESPAPTAHHKVV